jgi:dihydroflavonol-4-reductase
MAERAAWDFMDENDIKLTLNVINPPFVLGPVPLAGKVWSSTGIIWAIMEGTSPGLINMYLPFVDIRDVVQAHIQAAKQHANVSCQRSPLYYIYLYIYSRMWFCQRDR